MTKKYISIFLISVLIILLSISCAQIGSPVGGRKDTIAPKLVSSFPISKATNFRGKRINLDFDEYFTIKEQSKALLVSPPLAKKPEIIIKGKTIQITLDKTLDADKTYSLNFGSSILDLNENNPIKNFQFVLSTGDFVDSLCMTGQVLSAMELKPMKDIYVMLYDNIVDSIPRKTLPLFVSKTDDLGFFSIQNISKKSYKIFALKDLNANYRFDMPTEDIAFNDSTYTPYSFRGLMNDTIKIPTPNDTIFRDSIVSKMTSFFKPNTIKLYIFPEDNQKQYIKTYERKQRGKFSLYFNKPQIKEPVLKALNFEPKLNWAVVDKSMFRDSITYWISDSTVLKIDTLKFSIAYNRLDSLKKPFLHIDTLKIAYQPPKEDPKTKKPLIKETKDGKEVKVKPIVSIIENILISSNSFLDLYKDPIFILKEPLNKIELSKIHLWEMDGKNKKDVEFKLIKDSLLNTVYKINAKWIPQSRYNLYFEKAGLTSIWNGINDSIVSSFQVQKEEVYGVVNFKLKNFPSNTIVECLTKEDKLVTSIYCLKNTVAAFKTLKPSKYKFRIVVDLNQNKKWDTGDFSKRLQAEQVIPFGTIIEVKENWTNELEWDYNLKTK